MKKKKLSKTTLITRGVGGANVDPPSWKMNTFFLGSLTLSVSFYGNFQSNGANWRSFKLWIKEIYNALLNKKILRQLAPFDWKFLWIGSLIRVVLLHIDRFVQSFNSSTVCLTLSSITASHQLNRTPFTPGWRWWIHKYCQRRRLSCIGFGCQCIPISFSSIQKIWWMKLKIHFKYFYGYMHKLRRTYRSSGMSQMNGLSKKLKMIWFLYSG